MIITNGVGYVHIQKTAGTSIRQAMMVSGPTFYIGKVNRPKDDIGARSNRYNAHFNPSELTPFFKNIFTFTCIRNPWDRLVSWYAYAKPDKDFPVFVKELYKVDSRINSPIQGSYFKDISYDLVIKFEQLSAQWPLIQRRLNTPVELHKMNPSNHDAYQGYYTHELEDLVAERESYVINHWGYTFK